MQRCGKGDLLVNPIIGASVSVKGTKNATVTDLDGAFTLQGVTKGSTIVVFLHRFRKQRNKINQEEASMLHYKKILKALKKSL